MTESELTQAAMGASMVVFRCHEERQFGRKAVWSKEKECCESGSRYEIFERVLHDLFFKKKSQAKLLRG